jgi:xylulokinase
VLEGVAFNLYTGLLAFVENGTLIDAVDAIGGAANSPLLLQIFADVWGVPVTRRTLVDEATAVGAAIVAGVGVGIFDDFAVADRFSSELTTQRPRASNHERYGHEYPLFLDAYARLEPWFDKL